MHRVIFSFGENEVSMLTDYLNVIRCKKTNVTHSDVDSQYDIAMTFITLSVILQIVEVHSIKGFFGHTLYYYTIWYHLHV